MKRSEFTSTHAVVREAVLHLASTVTCTDACHLHGPLRGSMRLLHALWTEADRRLDAAPPTLRTSPDIETVIRGAVSGWHEAVALSYAVLDRPILPEHRIGQQVRSMHPVAFMREEWGTIVGLIVGDVTGDVCWAVRWEDGATDVWLPGDPQGMYEFREAWQA